MRRALAGVIFCVVALFTLSGCSTSSPDVKVIGDNIVNVPAGSTASFSQFQLITSTYRTWELTYVSDMSTVDINCTPMCTDTSVTLDTSNEKIVIGTNTPEGDLLGKFFVTRKADDSIDIEWATGISLND